jgi:hypothetical protein
MGGPVRPTPFGEWAVFADGDFLRCPGRQVATQTGGAIPCQYKLGQVGEATTIKLRLVPHTHRPGKGAVKQKCRQCHGFYELTWA